MKKVLLIVMAFVVATTVNAQALSAGNTDSSTSTKSSDDDSFTFLSLGYGGDALCDGVYIGFLSGKNVWKGLCLDYGLRTGWRMWSLGGASIHMLDVKVPVGIGYQIDLSKSVALVPRTGFNLGYMGVVSGSGGGDFAMGWDFGARLKLSQKLYLTYEYTIAITGQPDEHHAGIGIVF